MICTSNPKQGAPQKEAGQGGGLVVACVKIMNIAYILFDLDDTLYPPGKGLMQAISARMTRYAAEHLGLSASEADALRLKYYQRYGSSVHPLVVNHQLNLTEFLQYAHDVDVEQRLAPDADLDCLLACIQARKVIFTNGPRTYAQRVLHRLEIEHHFAQVFDYEFGEYLGKPDAAVYRKLQDTLNVPGDALVMVDDGAKNLAPARELGWKTIYVNANGGDASADVDFVVRDLWQIADAFHRLGVMDAKHRVMAEHRLAGCVWAERRERV